MLNATPPSHLPHLPPRIPAPLREAASALRDHWQEGDRQAIVSIEVPRFGIIKRRADGSIDFISPLPCPFNYGSIEAAVGGDGDPLDAIVLGSRHRRGDRAATRVLGVVWFIDGGDLDAKLICSNVTALSTAQEWTIRAFFRAYTMAKRLLNGVRAKAGLTVFAGLEVWSRAKIRQRADTGSTSSASG